MGSNCCSFVPGPPRAFASSGETRFRLAFNRSEVLSSYSALIWGSRINWSSRCSQGLHLYACSARYRRSKASIEQKQPPFKPILRILTTTVGPRHYSGAPAPKSKTVR